MWLFIWLFVRRRDEVELIVGGVLQRVKQIWTTWRTQWDTEAWCGIVQFDGLFKIHGLIGILRGDDDDEFYPFDDFFFFFWTLQWYKSNIWSATDSKCDCNVHSWTHFSLHDGALKRDGFDRPADFIFLIFLEAWIDELYSMGSTVRWGFLQAWQILRCDGFSRTWLSAFSPSPLPPVRVLKSRFNRRLTPKIQKSWSIFGLHDFYEFWGRKKKGWTFMKSKTEPLWS